MIRMREATTNTLTLFAISLIPFCLASEPRSPLWREDISLIPYPQQVTLAGEPFVLSGDVNIIVEPDASSADRFAASDLAARLHSEFGLSAKVGEKAGRRAIRLVRQRGQNTAADQGYELTVEKDRVDLQAGGEPGLFYATRTLLQIIKRGSPAPFIPGMTIRDRPDVPHRAVHYDTKHHQDKAAYVRQFIRDLADYKINVLIWEWEDKFAYPSHPEIGAPGAFTMDEMQDFTRYARRYHVQIVPLVQGLGHVSFILKWPQHAHLREIAASNWEFCPRKEGTYKLLFDLWDDAIKATPGSSYIHVGTDETYELGEGVECGCRDRAKQVGRYGLMVDFIGRASGHLTPQGRKVMAWVEGYRPNERARLPQGLATFPEPFKLDLAKQSRNGGYPAWIYDPNPGIEHLFLPYLYRVRDGRSVETSLQNSYRTLSTASASGIFEGMVSTSWDDSGLHNQVWMMRFVHAAEYSWNGKAPSQDEFVDKYLAGYYGKDAVNVRVLWTLLNHGAYYYMDTFQRMVWHLGDIGKTHLPDLPRGDAIEFDPYWNREYKDLVHRSRKQLEAMGRASEICRQNRNRKTRHAYDFEVFESMAALIEHTARTYVTLSEVESAVGEANRQHFKSNKTTYAALDKAAGLIESNIAERDKVFNALVAIWGKTRLPKGFSTPGKEFFHQQDRARHFAFRKPDMTYLIFDEQRLGLEDYLKDLREYLSSYRKTYLE